MKCEQLGMIDGLVAPKEKDRSHANRGRWLEDLCEWTHAIYLRDGLARVDRNYPETARLNADGWARVTGRGVCDYSGVIAGGTMVAFDAKMCGRKSIALDALKEHQADHLRDVDRLGGIAFVLVAFGQERVYAVPATYWIRAAEAAGLHAWHMRAGGDAAGRASIREADIPGDWAVAIDGRGVRWLETVRGWRGCP